MKRSQYIIFLFVLALVAGVFIFAAASVDAQGGVCDTNFLGNRIHACFFSWGGGNENAVPTNAAQTLSQKDFWIPENVGSYTVFDFKGGGQWQCSWKKYWWWYYWGCDYVGQNIENTGRAYSVSGIWRGVVKFKAGTYTFRTLSDDGVELLIDDQRTKLYNWTDHGDTWNSDSVTFSEPGWHKVQLKWYQGGGGARLLFKWDYQPTACDTSYKTNTMHACMYKHMVGAQGGSGRVPEGASTVIGQKDERSIPENVGNFEVFDYRGGYWERTCRNYGNEWCRWEIKEILGSGEGFQLNGIWRGRVKLQAGRYDFHTLSDDGVELKVNGNQLISNWTDHVDQQNDGVLEVSSSDWYNVQLKWFQNWGGATIKFWWDYYPPCDTSFKNNTLHACFFPHNGYDDIPTDARAPLTQRDEQGIPSPVESHTAFSYKPSYNQVVANSGQAQYVGGIWRGRINFKAGRYIFHTVSDDGVELRIDDAEQFRNWTIHGDTENTKEIKLTQGYHNVQLKWFQNWGGATIKFWWDRLNEPPVIDIIKPKGEYIVINPREASLDRAPREFPVYARASDPDSGRDPVVTFTILDVNNRSLLNTTVRAPNSNGPDGTAKRSFSERFPFYAPEKSGYGEVSRLRSTSAGGGVQILSAGVYTFKASAKDNQGAVTEKTVRVTINMMPVIERVSPSIPVYVKKTTDKATVTVEADATDADGISGVTIQQDSENPVEATRVGDTRTYRATFTLGVRDKSYIFTVRATDNNPVQKETSQNTQGITYTVRKANEPPAKPSFTIPGVPSGQPMYWLAKDKDAFTISVSNLTDPDNNISRVLLLVDGNEVASRNGGEIRDGRTTLQWSNPTDGRHTVNVRVLDYGGPTSFTVDGAEQTAEWNVTPVISFVRDNPTPLERARMAQGKPALLFPFGQNVRIQAKATDADGLSSVEYLEGTTSLGTGMGPNDQSVYTFVWKGDKEPGKHEVRAVATDRRSGVAGTSDTYIFEVEKPAIPDINITIGDRDSSGRVFSDLATRKQTINVSTSFSIAAPTTATLKAELVPSGGSASRQDIAISKGAREASVVFRDLSEGAYRLNLTLTDKYGSMSQRSTDFFIVKRNEAPIIESFSIEGVSGDSHSVSRPASAVLIAVAHDPDPTLPTLTLNRDGRAYSLAPSVSKVRTPSGRDGFEYRYTFKTNERGTFAFTVQASDGELSSSVSRTLSISVNNALPKATMIEPREVLTTNLFLPLYADASDPDGSIDSVSFTVYDSGNKVVSKSAIVEATYTPPSMLRDSRSAKKYYASGGPTSSQRSAGRFVETRQQGEVGVIRFPAPGIYTIGVSARDTDGGQSVEVRREVTINDIPRVELFAVREGPVVMSPDSSGRATVTLEAQPRDTVGGIASVTFYNDRMEQIAQVAGPQTDNSYRTTITLDARDLPYRFTAKPKDVHGAEGSTRSTDVKILKIFNAFPSAIAQAPDGWTGAYYVVPDDAPRFGFSSIRDEQNRPMTVEFMTGDDEIETRNYQGGEAVFEWLSPLYGRRDIVARLSNGSSSVTTPPLTVAIYDRLQLYDKQPQAFSLAAPYIHRMTTKTPRNGLVVLPEGGRSGTVELNVKVRSRGSRIRVVRVFEKGNEAAGKTVRIPIPDRDPKREQSLDFSFDGISDGVHTFVATAMDEPGKIAAQQELLVIVARYQANAQIEDYERRYGALYPKVTTRVPTGNKEILKAVPGVQADTSRPAIIDKQGKPLLKWEEEKAQAAQPRGIVDRLKSFWRSIVSLLRGN